MSILEPADKIYAECKPSETEAPCSCCTPPAMVKVHVDGTRRCHVSGKNTPATPDVPELLQMRRQYERYIRHLEYMCELH